MPLAEIDKMLELIKTPIKTPGSIFLQTTARNVLSLSSGLVFPTSERASRQSLIRVNTFDIVIVSRTVKRQYVKARG